MRTDGIDISDQHINSRLSSVEVASSKGLRLVEFLVFPRSVSIVVHMVFCRMMLYTLWNIQTIQGFRVLVLSLAVPSAWASQPREV